MEKTSNRDICIFKRINKIISIKVITIYEKSIGVKSCPDEIKP